ncbi:MAG: hypothetical protein C0594_17535, partial [Marinilabiliales bacterium]
MEITTIQKNHIEQINKELTDSIIYARRIQHAMLPPDTSLESLFTSYFIYFKPRDIVSGDFYWIRKKAGNIYVAAADCTGHGVPGAM